MAQALRGAARLAQARLSAPSFSFALRPEQDVRQIDASKLGSTTNLIITRYALPVPEVYPAGGGTFATLPPIEPTPSPSTSP